MGVKDGIFIIIQCFCYQIVTFQQLGFTVLCEMCWFVLHIGASISAAL